MIVPWLLLWVDVSACDEGDGENVSNQYIKPITPQTKAADAIHSRGALTH